MLKPCAHCGHDDPESIKGNDKIHPYRITCPKCGCGTAHHGSFPAAITAWNTRHDLDQAWLDARDAEFDDRWNARMNP